MDRKLLDIISDILGADVYTSKYASLELRLHHQVLNSQFVLLLDRVVDVKDVSEQKQYLTNVYRVITSENHK